MKKSAILLGGVCLLALVIGGGVLMMTNKGAKTDSKSDETKAVEISYWDKVSAINEPDGEGKLPLIKAVKAGDVKGVKFLLDNGANALSKDKNGHSALDETFKNKNVEILKVLLAKENIKLEDVKYMAEAIDANDAELVKVVLSNGGDANKFLEIKGRYRPDEELDYTDPRVITPLKKAVEEKKVQVAQVLLDNGAKGASFFLENELLRADLEMIKVLASHAGNLRNMALKGMDLLVASANEGKPEVLEFLLQKNAGDANDALSRLLLHYNDNNRFNDAVKMFLRAGATPKSLTLPQMLKKGNQEIFEEIANCFIDPNVKVELSQQSLLRYSVENGYDKAVDYLLAHNADIWQEDEDGKTPLLAAVENISKNPEIYRKLKAQIKDINEAGYKGESLLMLVASTGNFKAFQDIISEGGDIWQRDLDNKTVMMYAAEGGNDKIIEYLISKGDNVNTVDKNGMTALMYAARAGKKITADILIKQKAEVRAVDKEGRAAIMYAAENGAADILNMLLDAGESTGVRDNKGRNVMMYAAKGGKMSTVKALEERGIDPVAQDFEGGSVLSYAVQGGNKDIVKLLLDNNANPNVADKNGYQPMTWALKIGDKEIFDMVVSLETAMMQTKTRDNGKTLGMYAMEGKNTDLISWATEELISLYNKKDISGQSFFMLLAKDGRPDVVRFAVRDGGNVNATDAQGKTVLMYAAESEAAINLITILPHINEEFYSDERDNDGRSALMYAVGGEFNQSIKQQRLLQHQANVNGKDNAGKSVLMYAVGNPKARVDAQAVQELIDYQANVNERDNNGKTALMYAAENPNANARVVETLLDAKANIKAIDNNGKTILMYAAESGDISKFRLLLEKGASALGQTKDGQTVQSIADKVNHCFAKAVKEAL